MKILIAIIIITILILLYSVTIDCFFNLKNFDFSGRIILKTPFSKELFNTEKPKKKKNIDKKENKNKPKKKIDLNTVSELKEPLTIVFVRVCKVIKKRCKIDNLSISVKTALEDPMENGIAFGILSGVFNVGKAILMYECNLKDININITGDFESEEGLIFESFGTLKIRPLVLAVTLIFNFKLIKAIKETLTILKREDIVNG